MVQTSQIESTWKSAVAFPTTPFLTQQLSAREVPWIALEGSTFYKVNPTCPSYLVLRCREAGLANARRPSV